MRVYLSSSVSIFIFKFANNIRYVIRCREEKNLESEFATNQGVEDEAGPSLSVRDVALFNLGPILMK